MATAPPPGPPPKIGDVFCRDDEYMGRYESSVVWRNVRDGGHWEAMLVTNENFFPLSSARFTQAVHHTNWRPATWRWSDEAFLFAPANLRWDAASNAWVEIKGPVPEEAASAIPPKTMIPAPKDREHHATWRSRCRRKFPALDSDEGLALLGEVWNEYKTKG
tara:strand:+ start:1887 stop:2372 length:486 start_codon:yes stop_codon:yes gene_type:complete